MYIWSVNKRKKVYTAGEPLMYEIIVQISIQSSLKSDTKLVFLYLSWPAWEVSLYNLQIPRRSFYFHTHHLPAVHNLKMDIKENIKGSVWLYMVVELKVQYCREKL